jgi:hypothetical protein
MTNHDPQKEGARHDGAPERRPAMHKAIPKPKPAAAPPRRPFPLEETLWIVSMLLMLSFLLFLIFRSASQYFGD